MSTSESGALIATNAVFMGLAIASVALRLYTRQRKIDYLQADDFLILAALLFAAALIVTNIVGGAIGGFGTPFEALNEDQIVLFLKILFVQQFWYIIAVAIVKLSMLCLYGRLFSARGYPITVWIMIGLTICWLISFLFATFFQVWPIWCNWTLCIPTTDYPVMYVCCSVFDILLDIMILCLPATFVRNLQVSRGKKVGLISIFGLGIFCIVASIARLAYTVILVEANVDADFASNFGGAVVNMIMWSGIEASASIVCANLPCYASLFKDSPRIKSYITSIRGSRSRSRSYGSRGKALSDPVIGSGNNMRLQRLSSLEKPIVSGGTHPQLSSTHTSIRGGVGRCVRENELERGTIKVDYSIGVHQEG